MMNGGGWWMAGGGLIFVVLLAFVVVMLFARGSEQPDRTHPATPEEILRERLARGDNTEEDYRNRLAALRR
jgi:uncharacterized membrane protein